MNDIEMYEAACREMDAYLAYMTACETELCEPHTLHMWRIHGRPDGPLGGGTEC